MNLSIITCTIPERWDTLFRLRVELSRQINALYAGARVQHVVVPGPATVGEKIAEGIAASSGRYIAVVDDDDEIERDYVEMLLSSIAKGSDVVTFGLLKSGWEVNWLRAHLRDEPDDRAEDGSVVRMANHLCAWRRDLAVRAPCLPRNYGWDVIWYQSLGLAYPNLNEHHVPRVLYHYLYSQEGTRAQSRESVGASMAESGSEIDIVRTLDGRLYAGRHPEAMYGPDAKAVDLRDTPVYLMKRVVFT